MNTNYKYLRPIKGQHLKVYHDNFVFDKNSELKIEVIENAVVLPLKPCANNQWGSGGVIYENGKECLSSQLQKRYGGSYKYDSVNFIDQKVVYCGPIIKYWGHFLLESAARLWYVIDHINDYDSFVFLTDIGQDFKLEGNFKEFFELLGILDKVKIINKPKRFKEVVVPQAAFDMNSYCSSKFMDVFSSIIKNSNFNSDSCKKVFLSRSHLEKAKYTEFGLEILDNYFENNGFNVVHPQELSLSKLISILQSAEEIATTSGSLHHNILFANKSAKIYIIERHFASNKLQAAVNCMCGLDTKYVDAHFSVYSTDSWWGPCFVDFTEYFKAFSLDNDFAFPDDKFLSQKYLKRLFLKYMKRYRLQYQFNWYVDKSFSFGRLEEAYEAFDDVKQQFSDYLSEQKAIFFSQYFSIYYWRNKLRKSGFLRRIFNFFRK